MSAHEENWVVFQREVDDQPAVIRVDVGWADEEHDGLNLPAVVEFSARFKADNEDSAGMAPGDDEQEPLGALEDEIVDAMDEAGAVMVAAMTAENTRRWVFYAPAPETAETVLSALSNPADYALEARAGDDAAWGMYHDFFLPDEQEMSVIANQGVFHALAESGDIPERDHTIEHLAYLPTEPAADQFAAWATEQGFEIMSRYEAEDADEGMPSFAVEFSKVRPATMDAVMPDIDAATERAEDLDGFYDGWQTTPITE